MHVTTVRFRTMDAKGLNKDASVAEANDLSDLWLIPLNIPSYEYRAQVRPTPFKSARHFISCLDYIGLRYRNYRYRKTNCTCSCTALPHLYKDYLT